jgi:hypothetical protein
VCQGTDHFLAPIERKTRVISEDKESFDEGKPRSLEPQSTSAQALQQGCTYYEHETAFSLQVNSAVLMVMLLNGAKTVIVL